MKTEDPLVQRALLLLNLDVDQAGTRPSYFKGIKEGRKWGLLAIAVYCGFAVAALMVWLKLSVTPDTVATPFRFGGTGPDLFFFALMMLSLGWGGAWLGQCLATLARPLWQMTLAFLGLVLIACFFLWLSLSPPFFQVLSGPDVVFYKVIEEGLLGHFGVQLIQQLGLGNAQFILGVIEPLARISALLVPVLIAISMLFWVVAWLRRGPQNSTGGYWRVVGITAVLLISLCLCKLLAVNWASTDSVARMVLDASVWGAPGWFYLLLLVFYCCLGGVVQHYWRGAGQAVNQVAHSGQDQIALRVYSAQLKFLEILSVESRVPMDKLVDSVIEYFRSEVATTPDTMAQLENYMLNSDFSKRVRFAPGVIRVHLASESMELLSSLNCDDSYSESRVFRKLLEVFALIAGKTADH